MGILLGIPQLATLSLALCAACTPEVGLASGGAGGASVSTAVTATQTSTVAQSSGTGKTVTVGQASSGSGGGLAMENLYSRPYPASGSWKKTALKVAFPSDPNLPTGKIVSAVHLQAFDWMLWLTSDGNAHVKLASGWQSPVAIDDLLSLTTNCKKINQHKVASNCVDDTNPPDCVPVSALMGALVLDHIPPNSCGGTANTEGLNVISGSVATSFTVSAQVLPPSLSYGGQRDYLTDCSPDDPGAATAPLWGFQIARPSSCPGDWYDTYVFRADHQLYMQNAADVSTGTDTQVWPINATNPLVVSGDPNQPDLTTVTAAYYSASNGTLTLIAP